MRPRVFPAEDAGEHLGEHQARPASMRPRVFPAEDSARSRLMACTISFNEAAGIPRGRPPLVKRQVHVIVSLQ